MGMCNTLCIMSPTNISEMFDGCEILPRKNDGKI